MSGKRVILRIARFFYVPIRFSLTAEREKTRMKKENKRRYKLNFEEILELKGKKRLGESNVDFRRIENPLQEEPLDSFELEVRGKIASYPSPQDQKIMEEEKVERMAKVNAIITTLLRQAQLNTAEKEVFQLLYRERVSRKECAAKLGISKRWVNKINQLIIEKMKKVSSKINFRKAMGRN